MFKIGDEVRVMGSKDRARIVQLIDKVAILEYPNKGRIKVSESALMPIESDAIEITPERFDEAVKSVMYATAEEMGEHEDKLDQALEVVAAVSSQLKARLFNGN